MSFKLASVPDRPDAAPCSEEGLVAADAPSVAAAAVPALPTVHIVAAVGGETHEFDVPADRTVEFVKAYLDNKHGCVSLVFLPLDRTLMSPPILLYLTVPANDRVPFDKQTLRWNDRVLIDPMYFHPDVFLCFHHSLHIQVSCGFWNCQWLNVHAACGSR